MDEAEPILKRQIPQDTIKGYCILNSGYSTSDFALIVSDNGESLLLDYWLYRYIENLKTKEY